LWIMRKLIGQDLDRNITLQLGIASAIDLTHATFAKEADNFV